MMAEFTQFKLTCLLRPESELSPNKHQYFDFGIANWTKEDFNFPAFFGPNQSCRDVEAG